MMQLINNNDVRKYRQLGKQVNSDNFIGRVREVQENQLTELLGAAFAYDFENYLGSGWTTQAGTLTRISDYVFEIATLDLSAWTDYALKINSEVFVIVESAVFDGSKTTFIVIGYELPSSLTTLEYRTENNYVRLLNGTAYIYNGKTCRFNGVRPFLIWNFLTQFTQDADLKQSDVGNVNITGDLFQKSGYREKQNAISSYLQNATREENRIIEYLNTQDFELWEDTNTQSLARFDFVISD